MSKLNAYMRRFAKGMIVTSAIDLIPYSFDNVYSVTS
jgi:hypothetical protein